MSEAFLVYPVAIAPGSDLLVHDLVDGMFGDIAGAFTDVLSMVPDVFCDPSSMMVCISHDPAPVVVGVADDPASVMVSVARDAFGRVLDLLYRLILRSRRHRNQAGEAQDNRKHNCN